MTEQAGWWLGTDDQWHPMPPPTGWWIATDGRWYPPTSSSPPTAVGEVERAAERQGAWVTLVGGVLAVVAVFLPWMTARGGLVSVSRNALQLGDNMSLNADGAAALFLAVVLVLIGLSRLDQFPMPPFLARSPILPGLAMAGVGVYDAVQINQWATDNATQFAVLGVGYGVYLSIAAGLIAAGGGLILRRRRPFA